VPKTDFPQDYLKGLEENHREKVEASTDSAQRILMYSGARLNWIGEYINDESVHWKLEKVPVDSLTLTGTGPEWNKITIEQAERSPVKFRELLSEPHVAAMFESCQFVDIPILVRKEGEELKIIDGMNRTIAAIRDNIPEIQAYIGTRDGNAMPIVEPHVVYDFLKAFEQRGGDEEDFKGGLRFLINAYSNVRELLETRFSEEWIRNEKLNALIKEVLGNR